MEQERKKGKGAKRTWTNRRDGMRSVIISRGGGAVRDSE